MPPALHEIVQLTLLQTVGHVDEVGNSSVQFWKKYSIHIIMHVLLYKYDEEKQQLGIHSVVCNDFNICGAATESLPTRYSIAMVGVNVLETIAFQSSMQ